MENAKILRKKVIHGALVSHCLIRGRGNNRVLHLTAQRNEANGSLLHLKCDFLTTCEGISRMNHTLPYIWNS